MELGVAPTAMARDAAADAECILRIRNMATLAQSLNCPINYQVWKMPSSDEEHHDRYLIIVHVRGDWAFKKFLQHASACDLMLFRGLFLRMDVSRGEDRQLLQARVQQAFVPKFENDGADSQVAKDIVDNAHQRYMVVTIKHSGSLITLSSEVLGAKNSVNNSYTAGGQELIQAHFRRALGEELAEPHFTAFMEYLRTQRMAVGFEMVTASHGHHGQLPAGEYLVALSASQVIQNGSVRFLEWEEFLQLCLEWNLPANDTWLFSGAAAAAARAVLDEAAESGATTSEVLRRLDGVLPEAGGLRLPGTYPHDEWQGSRIEGLVVAQGQAVSPQLEARLRRLAERMAGRMIPLASVPSPLVKPFSHLQELLPHCKRSRQGDQEALEMRRGAAGEAIGPAFAAMPSSARLQLLGSGVERCQLLQLLLGPDVGAGSSAEGASRQLSNERLGLPSVLDSEAQVYCRQVLAQASLPQLLAEIDRSIAAGRRGSDAEELQRVRDALLAEAGGEKERARLVQLRLVRALAGAHELRQTLRYKKKMMMWSSSHMAYCMMTFLLRNGIHHLTDKRRPYPEQYLEYSRRLVARWKLAPEQRRRCQLLAQAWARWLLKRGALPRLRPEDYLEHAEPFVADFLAGRCTEAERPQGAFQGVVVALNLPALLVDRLVAALHLQHRLTAADFAFSRELAQGGCVVVWNPDEPLKLKKPDLEAAAPHLYVVKQPVQGGGGSSSSSRDKKANGMMGGTEKAARAALAGAGLADRQDQRILTLTAQPLGSGECRTGDDGAEGGATEVGAAETAAADSADNQQGLRGEREASGSLGAGAFTGPMRAVLEGADEQQPPGGDAMECDEDAGIAHMLQQVTSFLGKGAPVPETDAAAVFAFVSVPGIGKSTWASALREAGRADAGTQRVWLSSDRQYRSKARRKHFWPECIREAATSRGDGRCTVVLADRNLVPNYLRDARATQLEVVALQIRSSGVAAVAVLPCEVESSNPPCSKGTAAAGWGELCAAGPEVYPFPPHMLLLCMLRVLSRTQHEGDLHGGSDAPLSVVASMARQFRGMSAGDLRQKAVANFQFVVEVPVIEAAAPGAIPDEVVQHLVEGLRTVDPNAKKQQLPRPWEDRMADLLRRADVAAALRQLEVPLCRSLAVLEEQLQGVVGKLRPAGEAAAAAAEAESTMASTESIRYIAVEGVPRLPLLAAVREQLGEEAERNVKHQLHITLWHPSKSGPDADPDRRKQLLADLDVGVTFQITHLDHSPQVTAARVELLQAPEAAFQTHYPHITLLVADGATAADSALLPDRIADPEDAATSIALPQPLLLEGVLAGRP